MLLLIIVLAILVILLPLAGWVLWVLISAALVGAIIGALARLVIPGRQQIGVFSTIVIGWIGSLIGGLLGRHVFHVGTIVTVLIEVVIAAILVWIAASRAGNAIGRKNPSLRW